MVQDRDIVVPWLVLDGLGQWCLPILLLTYALARDLPQRRNPYFVNFILTTFLTTIPPTLLLYSGHQYTSIPTGLCLAQAALVDGIAPMFATAQLILVFDTWSELHHLCVHKPHISRITFLKCVLLIAPYFVLGFYAFASYQASLGDPKNFLNPVPRLEFVYCRNSGKASENIHLSVGIFLAVSSIIQIIFELWVAWMIYAYPSKVQDDSTAWRTTIQFSLRIIILSMLQFTVVLLSFINSSVRSFNIKFAYDLLDSTDALATFVTFATQKSVLDTWGAALVRVWNIVTRKQPEDWTELQPQDLPMFDWANVPKKDYSRGSLDGALEFEEKALPALPPKRTRLMSLRPF